MRLGDDRRGARRRDAGSAGDRRRASRRARRDHRHRRRRGRCLRARIAPALAGDGQARSFTSGPIGSASVIKVITNMLAFVHLVAAGEALMLAKRGGLDLAQAFHVIKASSGNSFVHETESQLILNGSYDINFTMDLACKDLGFAMKFGRDFGVPLDLAALTAQTFIRAREAYGGAA